MLRGINHSEGLILLKNRKVVLIRNRKKFADDLGPTWNKLVQQHNHNYEKIDERALTSTNKEPDFLLKPIKVKP